jgi:hypothetical protein
MAAEGSLGNRWMEGCVCKLGCGSSGGGLLALMGTSYLKTAEVRRTCDGAAREARGEQGWQQGDERNVVDQMWVKTSQGVRAKMSTDSTDSVVAMQLVPHTDRHIHLLGDVCTG